MIYENCQWCQGAGCLVCGSTRRQRLEREAALEEARRFLAQLVHETKADLQIHPSYLPIVAEAIRYGRQQAATERREERAAAAVGRWELLEIEDE